MASQPQLYHPSVHHLARGVPGHTVPGCDHKPEEDSEDVGEDDDAHLSAINAPPHALFLTLAPGLRKIV